MKTTDSPGIYVPPPLIYAVIFLAAVFIQKKIPIDDHFFKSRITPVIGILFLLFAVYFSARSMSQFIRTKNTIIPNKPAESLQTTGVYHSTRNPMYLALMLVYLGLSCLIGNWWNIILLPLLFLIIQEYIIKKEEAYLVRAFGQEYIDYRHRVRRWL
jgi:protein-S-isoprenylcysteine O-methyltransferase Ste14